MLAETLALALVLSSPGTSRARPALQAPPDNASRARRGLLPRKVVKTRTPRGRRVVLLPASPTWLGEPGDSAQVLAETGSEVVLEPAAEPLVEPVIAVASAVLPAEERPPEPLRASVEGAQVALLVRRAEEPQGAAVRAALAEPEVQVVLLRAPPLPRP